jgi:aldose sugar dehydrogenase
MFNKKTYLYVIIWLISLVSVSLWTFENPDKIELIKNIYKKNKTPVVKLEKHSENQIISNSFVVSIKKILSLSNKTAFVSYENEKNIFDPNNLNIYTQNGFLISNQNVKKMNLPDTFTLQRNGGVKTVIENNKKKFVLISNNKNKCFYASIINLENSKEIFNSKCLPDSKKKTDFNGLGASNIHLNDDIYISIGTPTQNSELIYNLAQKNDSVFGKIIQIQKEHFNEKSFKFKIFSKGHRNPQGLTKIKDKVFSVEHGPKGGDELNLIKENSNYGWPLVSYGTKYMYDNEGESYNVNHENKNFTEPLFALVPSVGISSLNVCPSVLNKYYNKKCLMALSLYGNSLRPGKSILIFLLNNDLNKVNSIEKIYLGDEMKLRHFVTNTKNELYEDKNGSIFVSVDKKGIYQINFSNFR